MSRTQYDWDALLNISVNAECGLEEDNWCKGRHAPIWELTRGEDFPTTMGRHSLQAAMHTKARKRGLRCHTAVQQNGLQVQFYKKEHHGIQTSN